MAVINYKNYSKGLLPTYIKNRDSFKDLNDEGFVQRFVGALGEEWDIEVAQQLEDVTKLFNPLTIDEDYLDYLAEKVGLLDLSQNTNHYRRLISFIINIWKIKGRIQSYKSIFYTLSYNINLTELPEQQVIYDESPAYIYDDPTVFYDNACIPCSEYEIDLLPVYDGLVEDLLDAATGWTLGTGTTISGGTLNLLGISNGEATKNFGLDINTNYTAAIEVTAISGGNLNFHMSNATDNVVGSAYTQLNTSSITVPGTYYFNFTTNGNAVQALLCNLTDDTETATIEKVRFFKTDTTVNGTMTSVIFERVQLLISLVEPINAKLLRILFDGDEVSASFITVDIDSNGDLVYNNSADPNLVLTLVNGELIIDGPLADRYFLQDGDLFFTTIT